MLNNNETVTKQYVVKHSDWIDKINRGGLVYPADDFFLLVREMENVMRKKYKLEKTVIRNAHENCVDTIYHVIIYGTLLLGQFV